MCKYCELKNGESIGLTDRKHDDLYISKLEDGYYIENEYKGNRILTRYF